MRSYLCVWQRRSPLSAKSRACDGGCGQRVFYRSCDAPLQRPPYAHRRPRSLHATRVMATNATPEIVKELAQKALQANKEHQYALKLYTERLEAELEAVDKLLVCK